MGGTRLEQRVRRAAEAALAKKRYVSAIDVFLGLGWLADLEDPRAATAQGSQSGSTVFAGRAIDTQATTSPSMTAPPIPSARSCNRSPAAMSRLA